jgi:hypothetical protein
MHITNIPQPIRRLASEAMFWHMMDQLGGAGSPVEVLMVGGLYRSALGPGRRKRSAHFELRAERDVQDWLRLQGLTIYAPSADAAVRSMLEAGRLAIPRIGKRYSVFAMLPSEESVALVRHDTALGRMIVDGQCELPYDQGAVDAAAGIADPITRVVAASMVDTHAVIEFTRGLGQ